MRGKVVQLLKLKARAQQVDIHGEGGGARWRKIKTWWHTLTHLERGEERKVLEAAVARVK